MISEVGNHPIRPVSLVVIGEVLWLAGKSKIVTFIFQLGCSLSWDDTGVVWSNSISQSTLFYCI